MSLRCFKQVSIERDISKTSQKHPKRDVFFETSSRRLKYISKKMSVLRRLQDVSNTSQKDVFFVTSNTFQKRCFSGDVFKASQTYLKKDVYSVTSLICLKHIS